MERTRVPRYLIRFEDGRSAIVEADRVVSFDERARQYLSDGALSVLYADDRFVFAWCRGSTKDHLLGFEPAAGWFCTCHIDGECPHLVALRAIVGAGGDRVRPPRVEEGRRRLRSMALEADRDEPAFAILRDQAARAGELESEIGQLRQDLARITELEMKTADAVDRAEGLRGVVAKRDARIEELEAEIERLHAAAAERARRVQAELAQVAASGARTTARAGELERELEALHMDRAERDARFRELELELAELAAASAIRDAHVQELELELQDAGSRLAMAHGDAQRAGEKDPGSRT
jgi:hypothetical protein